MAIAKTKSSKSLPLDGGTFVSLQKTIVEGDITMEAKLHHLYELQKADSKIDQLRLLRGELPIEVQDLEDEISGLRTRVEKFMLEIKDFEKMISQKKIEIQTAKDHIETYTSRQGNVKNNREFESLTKEIENLNLDIELGEKNIIEFTKKKADRALDLEAASLNLEERSKDLETKKRELDTIVAETQLEEDELVKKSEEIQSKIDARMLAAYHKVRSNSRNGLAVVTVKRDACSGCFNKIPAQRQMDIASSKKIIVCEYCGRILVNSDFEAAE